MVERCPILVRNQGKRTRALSEHSQIMGRIWERAGNYKSRLIGATSVFWGPVYLHVCRLACAQKIVTQFDAVRIKKYIFKYAKKTQFNNANNRPVPKKLLLHQTFGY